MHVMLTGGGSGGHVRPLLPVADSLKLQQPDIRLSYVGERGGAFGRLAEESGLFEKCSYVYAGKFRRYHGDSWLQKLTDIPTMLRNILDGFKTCIGIVEAIRLLRTQKPDAIFIKGGFVAVPVGLAAAILRISYITHDSDAVPGLANRIISKWARKHATGLPESFYSYPRDKTVCVGVPVSSAFTPATTSSIEGAKKALNLDPSSKVVLVTGGSQGAQRINSIVASIIEQLLADESVVVLHHVGYGNEDLYGSFTDERLVVAPFFDNFAEVVMAADCIVTRAGASSMAEFGVVGKPTVVIPSPFLANGHQLVNARELAAVEATVVVDEASALDHPLQLLEAVHGVLYNDAYAAKLSKKLQSITKTHAADDIATLLIEQSV